MTSETTSTDPGTADGGGAIDARVQAVRGQVAALEAALNASRKSRQIILLGLVAVIAVVAYLFYGLASRLRSEEYITNLSAEAQTYANNNADTYMREVKTLTDNVTPVITKAFYEQAKKDTPKLTLAMNKERELLMKNVQARLEKQINDQYAKILADYEEILLTEFPKVDDDIIRRRIMVNFREAMNRMVKRFYADQFQRELQAMYDTWDEFPIADAVEEGDVPMEDQLVGYLLELTTLKLSGKGELLTTERESSNATPSAAADDAATGPAPTDSAADEKTISQPARDDAKPDAAEKETPAKKDDARPSPPPEPETTPKETE
ncbi:MAG: hypothetical protein O3B13_09020 [Planctomycetota bacterium]|nr:hypothetical protein [Planctomycetota bacterium]